MNATGYESRVVSHIDPQLGTDLLRDLSELRVIDLARIGTRSGDDHLRLVLSR